jgi:hypothetical protein
LEHFTMSNLAIFSVENAALVSYSDKKNVLHSITGEGAIFKGGRALAALKDAALTSAGNKAASGRYRAASDIIAAAFPKQYKAYTGFMMTEPYANARHFTMFLDRVDLAEPGKNGWTGKQILVRQFINALRSDIETLKREPTEALAA